MKDNNLAALIQSLGLPAEYGNYIPQFFEPIVEQIVEQIVVLVEGQKSEPNKTPIIGINGAQGSGKSTAAIMLQYLLESRYQHRVAILSIDDFYHTRATRTQLAKSVHPLFMTRGVPGTHDIDLALDTFASIQNTQVGEVLKLPRFNKAIDDRSPRDEWEKMDGPPTLVIFEGWCVAAPAMPEDELIQPINPLEAAEDQQLIWRNFVNQQLQNQYQALFQQIDWLLMLKAPSFNVVYEWRLLQEQKLVESIKKSSEKQATQVLDEEQLKRFIQHYQRITEHCLKTIPSLANAVIELDEQHQMTCLQVKPSD